PDELAEACGGGGVLALVDGGAPGAQGVVDVPGGAQLHALGLALRGQDEGDVMVGPPPALLKPSVVYEIDEGGVSGEEFDEVVGTEAVEFVLAEQLGQVFGQGALQLLLAVGEGFDLAVPCGQVAVGVVQESDEASAGVEQLLPAVAGFGGGE